MIVFGLSPYAFNVLSGGKLNFLLMPALAGSLKGYSLSAAIRMVKSSIVFMAKTGFRHMIGYLP